MVSNSTKGAGFSLAYVSFLPQPDLFAIPPHCEWQFALHKEDSHTDTTQKDSEFFLEAFFLFLREFLGKQQIPWFDSFSSFFFVFFKET